MAASMTNNAPQYEFISTAASETRSSNALSPMIAAGAQVVNTESETAQGSSSGDRFTSRNDNPKYTGRFSVAHVLAYKKDRIDS